MIAPGASTPRLMRGDCLDLMPSLEAGSIDLIIADLPYGSTECAWDRRIDLSRFWPEARRLLSPGGGVVMFADMRYAAELIASRPKWFRYDLIWDKVAPVGFLDANRRPLRSHELMLIFGPRPPRYRPQKWQSTKRSNHRRGGQPAIYGRCEPAETRYDLDGTSRFPVSIHRCSNANGKIKGKVHPTQKPTALMAYLIRTFTDPGMTILDPTMGAGSSGLACLETGRRFVGIEQDAAYFKAARARIAAASKAAA